MLIPALTDAAASLCGIGVLTWLLVAVVGIAWRKAPNAVVGVTAGLGSLLILASAAAGGEASVTLPLPWFLGDSAIGLAFDPLSRWFLGIIGLIGLPVTLFSIGYLRGLEHEVSVGLVWSALAALLGSMVCVVLAANAIVFLVGWEAMALSSYALVAAHHTARETRSAALVYLGATRAGTAFLMGGFLWLHALTGSWEFADWGLSGMTALGPALLVFVGLATKAGCWPFHLWLPIAHPAAPAPVSALMSGVMIKTAIYAMVRLFGTGHISAPGLGLTILLLGAISGVWGVLFALLQHDIKRLLAYHSVENIGIILMGLGVSLLGVEWGVPALARIGLAACLLHTLNHAVFKSLLFLGAGAIDARTGVRDIEHLGGLLRRMPWTGAAFVVGSAAICALPPLNGFASEWLLYQAFFGLATEGPTPAARLGALVLMGWLGLIGALAIACFVKAIGVAFLGVPRGKRAAEAREVGTGMVGAQWMLACLCAVLGLCVPSLLGALEGVTDPLGGRVTLRSVWTVPTPMLALVLVATVGALGLWLATLARSRPAREYITWECGFGRLGPRMQYTATSFAQPISRLFGAVYLYAIEVKIGGRYRLHFPDALAAETTHEPFLETRLYTPALRGFRRGSGLALMWLQTGSIHQYLITMAVVLGILLWVGCR